jgi:CheY-like chemotaxis protein
LGHLVLIVDDDPASVDILAQLLRFNHFDVDVAMSGEEALGLIAARSYALLVLDLALPGMDGWELLKAVRSDPSSSAARVIALTAYYDPVVWEQARQLGFEGCYPKPAGPALMHNLKLLLAN